MGNDWAVYSDTTYVVCFRTDEFSSGKDVIDYYSKNSAEFEFIDYDAHIYGIDRGESISNKLVDKKMLERGERCTICLENVSLGDEVVELRCLDWYHGPCIGAWLDHQYECPLCRKGARPLA